MEESMHLLTEKLFRLEMLLHRHYHIHSQGKTENPHKGQGRVLMLLYKCGQISQRELPYLLDLRQQSVSELLLKLEKKGLIERTVSDEEKRGTVVSLTEEGRAAGAAAETERQAAGAGDVFSCLQEDERQAFESYLNRVIETLEAQLPDVPPGQHPHRHEPGRRPHGGFPPPQVWNLSETDEHRGHHGRESAKCEFSMDGNPHDRGHHNDCHHGDGCHHGKNHSHHRPHGEGDNHYDCHHGKAPHKKDHSI